MFNRLFRPIAVLAVLSAFLASPAVPTLQAQTATYSVVTNFTDAAGGGYPVTSLIQAANGSLYGATSVGGTNDLGVVYGVNPAGTISTFFDPCSGCVTPTNLIQGSDGNFYGVTETGGANSAGEIFKLSTAGVQTVLYSFKDSTDGSYPLGPLVQGSDGNLYGVAQQGGNLSDCQGGIAPNGCGTIFKYTLPGGVFSVVYTFTGSASDGGYPNYGLVQGSDGNFYGTTDDTVFKVTTGGTLTTIATSNFGTQGAYLNGPLVEGQDGSFYGTAEESGADGNGTIFKASVAGGYTLLYTFTGGADGGIPLSGLWEGTDGNFYGTNSEGGNLGCAEGFGCGVIYQVTSAGNLTVLYTFGTQADGILGGPGMIQGSNGSLYGTAGNGGNSSGCNDGCGVVFDATVSPAMAAPVVLSFSPTSVAPGASAKLSYSANNAISLTQQQCYAFGPASGGGTWTGKQTGTYSSTTHAWTGSATITPTVAGTYTYALTCGGQVSGFATLTVAAAKIASTTTLTASPSAPSVGQSVTLTATVKGSGATPTGSVTFYYSTISLGSGTLNGSGVATLTDSTGTLGVGSYPLTATYGGSTTYNASTGSLTVPLAAAPTTTTLKITPTTVVPPASATFTATVKRSATGATGTPSGSVTFSADGETIGTVNLVGGVATFTQSSNGIGAGTYPVTAKYNPDTSDVGSTSAAVDVMVQ